jgi:hypothetical protein
MTILPVNSITEYRVKKETLFKKLQTPFIEEFLQSHCTNCFNKTSIKNQYQKINADGMIWFCS